MTDKTKTKTKAKAGTTAKSDDWRKQSREADGSIRRRGSRLYARIQYTGEDGRRRDKERPARNRTHARELIKQMREMHGSYAPLTYILANEAVGFMWKDDFESAHAHLREALDYAQQIVMVQGVIDINSLHAITAFVQGDYTGAQGYVDAARAFAQH